MLPPGATDYYTSMQRLIVATLGLTRREWSKMGADFDASWANIAPRVELLTASAQLGAARNGISYVPRVLEQLGTPVAAQGLVNAQAFVGAASDGRPLGSLLEGAKIHAKRMNSLDAGGKWLDMAVHTQVQDAARGAASVAMAVRPGVGHVRVANPPCCGPCAVLSGAYSAPTAFKRHPRCDCFAVPSTDPRSMTMADPTIDQIRDLTEAERKALLEGSDLSRVINSRRGSKGLTTTELTGRGRFRGRTRLTPDGIFAHANGDRAEALRLLREHGYITPTGRKVAATSTRPAIVKLAPQRGVDLSGIRAAKTTQSIGDELQKVIGARGKVSGFDGAALDLERTRSAAEQTARMFDRYPQVNADVQIVKLGKPYAQAMGTRDGFNGSMGNLRLQISSSKLGKRSQVDEMFHRDTESGHFHAHGDADPMTYIVSHEFGHLVDFAGRGWAEGMDVPTPMPLRLAEIKKRLLGEEGIVNVNGREQYFWTKKNVSGYGQTNMDELVAEAFADVILNGDSAKPYSRLIHDEYVTRLKERRK